MRRRWSMALCSLPRKVDVASVQCQPHAFCPPDYRYGDQSFKRIWSDIDVMNGNSRWSVH